MPGEQQWSLICCLHFHQTILLISLLQYCFRGIKDLIWYTLSNCWCYRFSLSHTHTRTRARACTLTHTRKWYQCPFSVLVCAHVMYAHSSVKCHAFCCFCVTSCHMPMFLLLLLYFYFLLSWLNVFLCLGGGGRNLFHLLTLQPWWGLDPLDLCKMCSTEWPRWKFRSLLLVWVPRSGACWQTRTDARLPGCHET